LGAYAVLLAATWWRPHWPAEQTLHHSLTAVALLGVAWAQRRYPLPLTSWLLILCFLALHTIAARWIYSFVPYDDWSQAVLGVRLSDHFGWHRNDFDRLVHLSYGLCLTPVLTRYLQTARGWRPAVAASVQAVVSTGALYELFEWLVAVTLAPDAAEAYNGQQGDLWDSQKDMAIALLGALVAAGFAYGAARRRAAGTPKRGRGGE
jgi:putative membrane protein